MEKLLIETDLNGSKDYKSECRSLQGTLNMLSRKYGSNTNRSAWKTVIEKQLNRAN
jgi:hypothetical protein